MIAAARRNRIKELLLEEKSVRVTDLAESFKVSEETIRRDLSALEQEGVVKKNYGGAVLLEAAQEAMVAVPPVQQRKLYLFEEKDAIGAAAASMVSDGDVIILDAGSTTWCIARHLADKQITIVTNGITVAEECSHVDDPSVLLIGGKLLKKSMSLVGPQAEREIQRYNADYVFVGTSGISIQKGFTSTDIYEAEIKRAMISTGKRAVIVADHSKFDRQGLVSFSSLGSVYALITSDLADSEVLDEIRRQGVKVITVPVEDFIVSKVQ